MLASKRKQWNFSAPRETIDCRLPMRCDAMREAAINHNKLTADCALECRIQLPTGHSTAAGHNNTSTRLVRSAPADNDGVLIYGLSCADASERASFSRSSNNKVALLLLRRPPARPPARPSVRRPAQAAEAAVRRDHHSLAEDEEEEAAARWRTRKSTETKHAPVWCELFIMWDRRCSVAFGLVASAAGASALRSERPWPLLPLRLHLCRSRRTMPRAHARCCFLARSEGKSSCAPGLLCQHRTGVCVPP